MADNLVVTLGVDSGAFKSGMSDASSAAQRSFATIRAAARAAAADTSVVDSASKGYSQTLLAMIASTNASAAGMRTMAAEAKGAASATEGVSFATAGTTREFIVLGHEMVSGNFSRVPGSLMVLMERMGGLKTSMLGAVGAVAAVGYGLFELTKYALDAANELKNLQGAMLNIGRGSASDMAKAKADIDGLRESFGLSTSAATEVVQQMKAIPRSTDEIQSKLAALAIAFADINNVDNGKAAKEFAAAASGGASSALRFGDAINLFSAEQKKELEVAKAANDVIGAQRILVDALTVRYGANLPHLTSWTQALRAAQQGGDMAPMSEPVVTMPRAAGPPPDQAKLQLFDMEQKYNRTLIERGQIETDLKALEAASAAATDTNRKKELAAEIEIAQKRLDSLNGVKAEKPPSQLEGFRTELAQMQADFVGTNREMQVASVTMWLGETNAAGLSAKEQLAAQRGLAQAIKVLNAEVLADNKKLAAQTLAEKIQEIKTEIQSDQDYFDQKAQNVKMQLDLGKISTSQEIAQLKEVEIARFEKLNRDLQEEMQFDEQNKVAKDKLFTEIEKLKREHDNKMGALDIQAAQASFKAWDTALQPIKTAFDGMLQGILTGTQTFQQAMKNVAQKIVVSYAEMGVKVVIDWVGHQLAMTFASEIAASKSALSWIGAQLGITSAEAAGGAAHVGIEAAKTGATAAGASTRVGIETAAASESLLMQIGSSLKVIAIRAYEAAAGAWAAISAIPYVGPFLAPVVAAGVLASVIMLGKSISAAGGYDIPAGVNPIVQAHAEEMILPAAIATPLRVALAGGGIGSPAAGGANGNAGGGGVQNFYTTVNVTQTDPSPAMVVAAVREAQRNFHPATRG